MKHKRTGFAAMRCQPAHEGHLDILTRITRECDVALLGLGSTGNDIDESNPWNQVIRTEMIRNVFGDRLIIIPLEDLPKSPNRSKNDWVKYVLEMCKKYGHENVTDYYSGSRADAVWYAEKFYNETMINPLTEGYGDLPSFDDDDDGFISPDGQQRLLHIIDREKNDCPSATELRTLISLGEEKEWKKWIPRVNHDIIIDTYPKKFIMR